MGHCVHFASDLHLGAPNGVESRERERTFVQWMRAAAEGTGFAAGRPATELHLVGDIFDFWHEYRHAIPKGGTRVMGAIAELTDGGLPIHFHAGNHDMWTYGYLEEELGVQVHDSPVVTNYDGLKCMIGHGDGLGKGDKGYRSLKRLFTSSVARGMFRRLHPDLGIRLARAWSAQSRDHTATPMANVSDEHLYQYAALWNEQQQKEEKADLFIFGHRHLPLEVVLPDGHTRYLNTGDWLQHRTSVALVDGQASLLHHR